MVCLRPPQVLNRQQPSPGIKLIIGFVSITYVMLYKSLHLLETLPYRTY
jgi:hypothetical protein